MRALSQRWRDVARLLGDGTQQLLRSCLGELGYYVMIGRIGLEEPRNPVDVLTRQDNR
ncbi:hypothetical protein YIM_11675 [Amycolatopsis sp. YIM 10]|nr:hypothetical protein YIM_11675 [Amycolatopsis sp. YIM 10]